MKNIVTIVQLSLAILLGFQPTASSQNTTDTTARLSRNKIVLLDRFFNSETRKDTSGKKVYWHYVWTENSDPGFSILGNIFSTYGAKLSSLDSAPAKESLQKASVYIIVDPDNTKDNPHPNYINSQHIKAVTDWVKSGGTLLLMGNDSVNCDLVHFNKLASAFGITFSYRNANMVKGEDFEMGAVFTGEINPIFNNRKLFLKDISLLEVKPPASPLIKQEGAVIMAISSFGKGRVFAVGDPWLYNEYVNGRLPPSFDNLGAADDLARWLLGVIKPGL